MPETSYSLIGKSVDIRPFLIADISDTYIHWLNDLEVVKFSNQRFISHGLDSCLRYQASFKNTDNLFMAIRRLSDGKMIGTITAYISKHHGTADVGILIGDKTLWGMGYGLDAWITFTNWLLDQSDIRKLTAGTLACNFGMIKLMERSGMVLEATRKAQELIEGQPTDILYYAKFNGN